MAAQDAPRLAPIVGSKGLLRGPSVRSWRWRCSAGGDPLPIQRSPYGFGSAIPTLVHGPWLLTPSAQENPGRPRLRCVVRVSDRGRPTSRVGLSRLRDVPPHLGGSLVGVIRRCLGATLGCLAATASGRLRNGPPLFASREAVTCG